MSDIDWHSVAVDLTNVLEKRNIELAASWATIAELSEDVAVFELQAKNWTATISELAHALQGLHDDIADYARLNHLGGFCNHWMVIARAALAKADHTRTPKATECRYCKRSIDSEGCIVHEGWCKGLQKVEMNQLQYDALTGVTT